MHLTSHKRLKGHILARRVSFWNLYPEPTSKVLKVLSQTLGTRISVCTSSLINNYSKYIVQELRTSWNKSKMGLVCICSPLEFNIPCQDKFSVIDKHARGSNDCSGELLVPKPCGPNAGSCLPVQVGNSLLEVCKLLRLPLSLLKDRDSHSHIIFKMNEFQPSESNW